MYNIYKLINKECILVKVNRNRSSNIMIIAIITTFVGIIAGVAAGCLSGVEIKSVFYFNWYNALIVFAPLLAAGMILLGVAQLTSLGEDLIAEMSEEEDE